MQWYGENGPSSTTSHFTAFALYPFKWHLLMQITQLQTISLCTQGGDFYSLAFMMQAKLEQAHDLLPQDPYVFQHSKHINGLQTC